MMPEKLLMKMKNENFHLNKNIFAVELCRISLDFPFSIFT